MAIKKIDNELPNTLLFVKLEDTGDNRVVGPNQTEDTNVWMPWADDVEQFSTKAIIITDLNEREVIAYLWEHSGTYRYMTTLVGKFDPKGTILPGVSKGDIDLVIDKKGNVRGDTPKDEPEPSTSEAVAADA